MACDTRLRPRQTLSQRTEEVRAAVKKAEAALIAGRIKAKIGPQGAVAFEGMTDEDRSGVSDACIYRRIMATGSALAKQAIVRAEQLAGRSVDRTALAAGWHAHDGVWHRGH